MTCTARPYVSSKYDIVVDVSDVTTPIANFSELTLVLTLLENPATTVTFTKTGGGLIVSGTTLTLSITDSDITTAGSYKLKLSGVISGQNVKFSICTGNVLTFYEHS